MSYWVPAIVTFVTTVFASGGFWAYLTHRDKTKNAYIKLLMGMGYDRLLYLGMSYIERGWITKDEYEDYRKYFYDPYTELGGNGMAERVMADVMKLPFRSRRAFTKIIDGKRAQGVENASQDSNW